MKRRLLGCLLALVVLGLCVSLGSADLVTDRPPAEDQGVPPGGVRSYVETFKGNKRALVIASGKGDTCLGLYVFDAHGNCVAHDDLTTPQTSDDLAAEWFPAETARYDVEIYNGGTDKNVIRIAIR